MSGGRTGVTAPKPSQRSGEKTDHLRLLWTITAGHGFHEVWLPLDNGQHTTYWLNASSWPQYALFVGGNDGAEVSLVPRAQRDRFTTGRSHCLWTRVESGASLERLRRFRPNPTLVLREGSTVRTTALWALHNALPADDTERANKRIAHSLGAPKKYADPKHLIFPFRRGRHAVDAHVHEDAYSAAQVVRHLPDAPAPWTPERVAA